MTEAEIKAWQERYTFYCPDLDARLTPEQCRANRHRYGGWDTASTTPAKIFKCISCTKYEERIATVPERRDNKEADTMARRGNCEVCGRGPFALSGGLCGDCGKHRTLGELVRSREEWEWLVPVPEYVSAEEERKAHKSAKLVCKACEREFLKLCGRGLCSACYAHWKKGTLVEKGKGSFAWKGDPPQYVSPSVLEEWRTRNGHDVEDYTPSEREIDEARHGIPQEEPELIGMDMANSPDRSVIYLDGIPLTKHMIRKNVGPVLFASVRTGEKSAEVALNAAAVVRFGLEKVEHVEVYKNIEHKILALVPLDEACEGSVSFRATSGERTRIVSATVVLRELGVKGKGRYNVRQEQGVVIVDFKEEAA